MARDLHAQTNESYPDRQPIKLVEKPAKDENSDTLPPLKSSTRTKSVTSLSNKGGPMNKYVKKNQHPIDI